MNTAEISVVTAAIAAAAALGGTWITLHFTRRSERERGEREVTARREDRAEAVRARLHRDKLDTYRAFTNAYGVYEISNSRVSGAWARRSHAVAALDGSSERTRAVDAAMAEFTETAMANSDAFTAVQQAIELLQLVSSEEIAAAAVELAEATGEAFSISMRIGEKAGTGDVGPDLVLEQQAARTKRDETKKRLQALIRAELQAGA